MSSAPSPPPWAPPEYVLPSVATLEAMSRDTSRAEPVEDLGLPEAVRWWAWSDFDSLPEPVLCPKCVGILAWWDALGGRPDGAGRSPPADLHGGPPARSGGGGPARGDSLKRTRPLDDTISQLWYLTAFQLSSKIHPMARKPNRLSDQIRQAIDGCGQTRYQIWQATGVPQETLCRFMAGKAGLSMPVLDKLAEHLGLRIVADKPRQKKGGK